jgi:gluconolactonase
LIGGIPSPNGIALDVSGKVLYVAVTRANQVWRGPLLADGSTTKVGAFRTFFGASGPDGMAVDVEKPPGRRAREPGRRLRAQRARRGHAFREEPAGSTVTNVAYRPGTPRVVMTESRTGSILEAELPRPGWPLYSHA